MYKHSKNVSLLHFGFEESVDQGSSGIATTPAAVGHAGNDEFIDELVPDDLTMRGTEGCRGGVRTDSISEVDDLTARFWTAADSDPETLTIPIDTGNNPKHNK